VDQLEERILQTDQLKDALKRLQHRVDHTPRAIKIMAITTIIVGTIANQCFVSSKVIDNFHCAIKVELSLTFAARRK